MPDLSLSNAESVTKATTGKGGAKAKGKTTGTAASSKRTTKDTRLIMIGGKMVAKKTVNVVMKSKVSTTSAVKSRRFDKRRLKQVKSTLFQILDVKEKVLNQLFWQGLQTDHSNQCVKLNCLCTALTTA